MAVQKSNINLFSQDEFEKTQIGKFFKWALTFGKYIVILTQLVVIVAFLYRFKLDRDLDLLNEKIADKQKTLITYQELEHKVHIIQDQLSIIKTISESQNPAGQVLQNLSQITPLEVELESLNFTQKSFNLDGKSLSEVGLATLVSGLEKQPNFEDVRVSSVESGGAKDPSLSFTINSKIILPQENLK